MIIDSFRTCSSSSSVVDSAYSWMSKTGKIVVIVVSCLVGVGILIAVIVIVIVCHKKKQTRVMAIQPMQQSQGQFGGMYPPAQPWPQGGSQYASYGYGGPMPHAGPGYPPSYPSVPPVKV